MQQQRSAMLGGTGADNFRFPGGAGAGAGGAAAAEDEDDEDLYN